MLYVSGGKSVSVVIKNNLKRQLLVMEKFVSADAYQKDFSPNFKQLSL